MIHRRKFILSITIAHFLCGCFSKPSGSLLVPSTLPSSSASISTGTCTTTWIDFGEKGVAAATARGAASDVAMIPGTTTSVVALVDPNAVAIKLKWWNGSSYSTETVSGEGSGTFVRLTFLSDGRPFVFWASGTRIRGASRSTPLSAGSGVWTGATIDTVVAPRALEVSVSPLDDVLLGYYTDTLTTGRFKVAICPASCTSVAGMQTMAPAAYVENSNIQAAGSATGVAWCKASSSLYYPAVTYSLAAATRYGVCQFSAGNCIDSTKWSLGNVLATATLTTKLLIDSSVTGDVPKVMVKGAGGLVPYSMTGSTACTAAVTTFTAGTTLAASINAGTQWASLRKSNDGNFHLAANNSTTHIYYYNTSGGIFGTWNATNTASPVDTVTLAATQTGGATLDSSNNVFYMSYGINAANYNVFSAWSVSNATSATSQFQRNEVDPTGQIQLTSASNQRFAIDVAKTSAGRPAAAWIDASIGATAGSRLKYALRAGVDSSSVWPINVVDGPGSPQYPSLALDENNRPWIGYFDASDNRFKLANNSQSDGSGVWSIETFPALPTGAPATFPAANNTAMAMYAVAGVWHPVMIVLDNNVTSRGVKAALYNKTTRQWSTVATVDALTGTTASNVTVDFTTTGSIALAYYDQTTLGRARYSYTNNGTSWSAPLTVAAVSGRGAGLSLKINPTNGKPAMAYYDRANNSVYYHSCAGTVAACASSGWSAVVVDSNAGVSGLTNLQEQLLSSALNFRSDGTIDLFYLRGAGANGALVRAVSTDGVTFTPSILINPTASNLTGIAALNFGIPGWNARAITNSSGNPTLLYIGAGNYLASTSCGD